MNNDPIIFGKSNRQKIVSIETSDGQLELFIKNEDGTTRSEFITNKYWILSSEAIHPSWTRLKGDLHYKYGKQFDQISNYYSARMKLKHKYDIYSIYDVREASMINKGICYFQGLQPKDLSVLSFDIETTGITHNDDSKLLIIANTFRDSKGNITRKLFAYDEYSDEGEMIFKWCQWVRSVDPDILVLHNGLSFDLPYIKFVSDKFNVSLDLGRDGSAIKFNPYMSKYRIDGTRDQEYNNCRVYGREIFDTYFGLIKWDSGKELNSYGLKSAISQLGLEVENRQFYDGSKIKDNYTNPIEWEKIKSYATFDGDDSLALFDKICGPYFYWTQSCPKPFQQIMLGSTGSQINSVIVRSYLQNGHSISKAQESNEYEGAISMGLPGVYSNSFKVDILSCYPNTLLQYNIYDKNRDPQGNVIKITDFFFNKRKDYKKLAKETGEQHYKDLDTSFKLIANSIYGFYGAKGLNYNFPSGAAEITKLSRGYIEKAILWATGKEVSYWKEKTINE
jgi:DNA polymerase I